MIIYRLDNFDAKGWPVKWFTTKAEAEQYQREINRSGESDWDLEEFEIGENINAFVGFLNFHATNVTGDE